ncbi:MAG: Putative metallo-dependent phosphatase [Thermoanaerobacterales bacterium 50_218]|nr:MAG: Putative metallo-dependent phosphatase [Thermoanaerobacterales bacterium 50_218]HAA89228.1 hypothetical protein [Peptococcaceae bacterium]
MRLLHTADVHLHPERPERWEAFRAVCGLAQERKCAALLVAGDLFDSFQAAVELRPRVRELLETLEMEVFLISGNHDAAAFGSGEYYGKNVHIAGSGQPVVWDFSGVSIVGLPYTAGRGGCEFLQSSLFPEKVPLIVLAHANFFCSASSRFYFLNRGDALEEAHFWDRDFEDFPVSYIALGHWHNPTLPAIEVNRAKIAYSGTPYPLAKGENGARKVFLIEVSGGCLDVEAVDVPGVPRRETASFCFVPGSEEQTLEEIRDYLFSRADTDVILDLEVAGWISQREDLLLREVENLVRSSREGWKAVNLAPGFVSIGSLSGIGRKCLQLLRETEPPADPAFAGDPVLGQLVEEVVQERELLYREALSLLLRHLGKAMLPPGG